MVTTRQARWTGMIVLVIAFLAGSLVGAATMHVVEADEAPAPRSERPDLFERLQLTPEQQAQVNQIMERRRQEVHAFWQEHGPRMEAIYDSTRVEFRAVLTPEQRALDDRFRTERQQQFERRRGDHERRDR